MPTEASPLVVATTTTTKSTANRVKLRANVAAIVDKIIKLKKASPVDKDAIRASVKELIHNDGIGLYGEKWEEPFPLTKKQKQQAKEKAKMSMDAAAEKQANEKAEMDAAAAAASGVGKGEKGKACCT